MSEEVRVKDEKTGGEKGSKLARFDLIPQDALWALAEHYGKGCQKYSENNWMRGYKWGLSFAAAQRHLSQFWNGENVDEETKSLHCIAAAWHCLAMASFVMRKIGTDDRPTQTVSAESMEKFYQDCVKKGLLEAMPASGGTASYVEKCNQAWIDAKPLFAEQLAKDIKTRNKIWSKFNARKRKV